MAISQIPQNKCLGVASWKHLFYSRMEHQPQSGFLLESETHFFPTWASPMPRAKHPTAVQFSLGPGCPQGGWLIENHSKRDCLCGKYGLGLKMPSFHKWEPAAYSELGRSGTDGNLTEFTKQASGSGLLPTYILFRGGTPAPIWVCSGKPP